VQRVLTVLERQIQESGARVEVGDLPTVHANDTLLAQIFQNLVSNATKFKGDAPLRIAVSAERGDGCWQFAVADNGIGIDPNAHDRIFQIFQRLHTRREFAGTGIGLAVCKRIAERHGGRIWVQSEPGKGSTFYFSIPDHDSAPFAVV
jgi:two-component system, chemotaxis family, sensor kinase Cph1